MAPGAGVDVSRVCVEYAWVGRPNRRQVNDGGLRPSIRGRRFDLPRPAATIGPRCDMSPHQSAAAVRPPAGSTGLTPTLRHADSRPLRTVQSLCLTSGRLAVCADIGRTSCLESPDRLIVSVLPDATAVATASGSASRRAKQPQRAARTKSQNPNHKQSSKSNRQGGPCEGRWREPVPSTASLGRAACPRLRDSASACPAANASRRQLPALVCSAAWRRRTHALLRSGRERAPAG